MSAIGVTPFKRHALHAWVPDSRHVSLSRCDPVFTYLPYLRDRRIKLVGPARAARFSELLARALTIKPPAGYSEVWAVWLFSLCSSMHAGQRDERLEAGIRMLEWCVPVHL